MQENQPTGSTEEAAPPAPVTSAFSPAEIVQEFKGILLSPKEYFANMPVSGGFQEPVKFYIVVAGVNAAFTLLFGLLNPIATIIFVVQFFLGLIASCFAGAAVDMAVSRVLGGTGDYEATYRACAYSSAPHVLGWVPFINVIAAFYSLYLLKLGLERAQGLPPNRAILVVAAQVGIVLIAAVVMMILGVASLMGVHR